MERICIAALTFFNVIIYHTADSVCIFVAEIVPHNKNFYIMYKVVISKSDSESHFCGSRFFECYLESSDSVCALIQRLSMYDLHFSLEHFEFSKCDVIDTIKDHFKL